MATVFLAQDLRRDRPVALKVLHPELACTLGPKRFQREICTTARLQHPHRATKDVARIITTVGQIIHKRLTSKQLIGEDIAPATT